MAGAFVISLDFELMWGVRDHATPATYGNAILGGREAIPQILQLFERTGTAATWATVGLLLARDRDTMIDHAPAPELRPSYAHAALSPYPDLSMIGRNEADDPLHYGLSLARRILDTPGQTIGTHTFSHFYTLEPGGTVDAFHADLSAAKSIAADAGLPAPKSIVFPRNQVSPPHVAACVDAGIPVIRGNPPGMAYRAMSGAEISPSVRAYRLADALAPLPAIRTTVRHEGRATDVPATRFLRPASGATGCLTRFHIRRIKFEMMAAAKAGRLYHLWWHPHNFGRATGANMAGLSAILMHGRWLAERYDFPSLSMEDAALSLAPLPEDVLGVI